MSQSFSQSVIQLVTRPGSTSTDRTVSLVISHQPSAISSRPSGCFLHLSLASLLYRTVQYCSHAVPRLAYVCCCACFEKRTHLPFLFTIILYYAQFEHHKQTYIYIYTHTQEHLNKAYFFFLVPTRTYLHYC